MCTGGLILKMLLQMYIYTFFPIIVRMWSVVLFPFDEQVLYKLLSESFEDLHVTVAAAD